MRMLHRRHCVIGLGIALAGCISSDSSDADGAPAVERVGPMIGDRELLHNKPFVLEDTESGDTAVDVHYHGDGQAHWHFQPLEIPLDESRELHARVIDADGDELDLTNEGSYHLTYDIADDYAQDVVRVDIGGHRVTIEGQSAHDTRLIFTIHGPEDATWTTPEVRVVVEPPE